MKRFLSILIFSALFALGANAQSLAAGNIQSVEYANQTAGYDSVGRLGVAGRNVCAQCPTSTVVYVKQITLNSSQIQNMYSVPDTLLPAPPRYYSYNIMNVYAALSYNSIAYTSDSIFIIKFNTGNGIAENVGVLSAGANTTSYFGFSEIHTGSNSFPSHQPLLITTRNANPASGNSTVVITLYYTLLPQNY